MKIIFALLAFAFSGSAYAATYAFIPNAATEPMCRELGMVGEFRLSALGSAWKMTFATKTNLVLNKTSRGVYHSIVKCAVGCSGFAESRLNLNTKAFQYWNSIDRAPQKCVGTVVVNPAR